MEKQKEDAVQVGTEIDWRLIAEVDQEIAIYLMHMMQQDIEQTMSLYEENHK